MKHTMACYDRLAFEDMKGIVPQVRYSSNDDNSCVNG